MTPLAVLPLFTDAELDLVRRAFALWRRCHDGDAPCLAARLLERLEHGEPDQREVAAGTAQKGSGA